MQYLHRTSPDFVIEDPIVAENLLDGLPVVSKRGHQFVQGQPHVTYVPEFPDRPLVDRISFGEIAAERGFNQSLATKCFGYLADRLIIDNASPERQQKWFGSYGKYPGRLDVQFGEVPGVNQVPSAQLYDYVDAQSLARAIRPVERVIGPEPDVTVDETNIVKKYFGKKTAPTHVRIYSAVVDEILQSPKRQRNRP